jgi:16S rRNA (cytosine967-C5)-methyltransferase
VNRPHSYLHAATQILQQYKGLEPFSSFLKKFFSACKKYGSRDRKVISQLCYCFFRTVPPPPIGGIRDTSSEIQNKIIKGLFLCSTEPNEILAALKPEWNEKANLSLYEKSIISGFQLQSVFPWKNELSCGMDYEKFCTSFLIQPDLFLRLRPGKEKNVRKKLRAAGIHFKIISDCCLALPNATKIDSIVALDEEAVVQDYSSQRVGEFLPVRPGRSDRPVRVWDCCAGSGGKSILAYDRNPAIQLTVSDVRESILANLKKRFKKAGINKYTAIVVDLTDGKQIPDSIAENQPSIIIADVPCTGSGTWGRTPEQRFLFDERKIDEYAAQQKRIVTNAITQLEPGGNFLYITCSVFRKENEDVVKYLENNFPLQRKKMEILNGYDKKADTLFAALLQKPL